MTDEVEVWLDADFLERTRVGTLSHDRGTLRFVYEPTWLKESSGLRAGSRSLLRRWDLLPECGSRELPRLRRLGARSLGPDSHEAPRGPRRER